MAIREVKNTNLHQAKRAKNDEFYTRPRDIELELSFYTSHFEGKRVFLNCDDSSSEFLKYFIQKFNELKLESLTATHFDANKPSYKLEVLKEDIKDYKDPINEGFKPRKIPLSQNGDFRSEESIAVLKESDIVVTNPPFSLFREFMAQLVKYDKKFLVIGNKNSITYKELFPLIKENKLWLGCNLVNNFRLPSDADKWSKKEDGFKIGSAPSIWFTNLEHSKRMESIPLFREYTPHSYPKYDNYDAIEVSKVSDIPENYPGVMGVPVTFLTKYNPDQFEILDINPHFFSITDQGLPKPKQLSISGQKDPYARILIRHR